MSGILITLIYFVSAPVAPPEAPRGLIFVEEVDTSSDEASEDGLQPNISVDVHSHEGEVAVDALPESPDEEAETVVNINSTSFGFSANGRSKAQSPLAPGSAASGVAALYIDSTNAFGFGSVDYWRSLVTTQTTGAVRGQAIVTEPPYFPPEPISEDSSASILNDLD